MQQSAAIYPAIGLAVIKNRQGSFGGAYRAWQLARIFDVAGSGAVDIADFQEWADVKPRTLRQWIADAIELRLFVKVKYGTRIMISSDVKAAAILGCARVDSLKVKVSVSALAGRNWKALIFAAVESPYSPHPGNRQPISRKQLYRATGITPRTQQRYDNAMHVKRHQNYAKSVSHPSELAGMREYSNRVGAFVWYDIKTGEEELRYRLPDDRDTSRAAVQQGRGRSRKVNKALKSLGCSNRTQPVELVGRARLFNNTLDELDRSTKHLGDRKPAELYLRTPSHSRNYGLWAQIPMRQNLSDNSFRTTGDSRKQPKAKR